MRRKKKKKAAIKYRKYVRNQQQKQSWGDTNYK